MTVLFLAALALLPLDFSNSTPYERFEGALESLQTRYAIPGLAVAIVADGEVAFARGYGWADLETQRPVTASTPFRIASLTKPLAATLLLRFVEQGQLDLDQPFADYVAGYDRGCQLFTSPEALEEEPALRSLTEDWRCEEERERLTVRHYLTHTAQGEPGASYRYNGFLYGQLSRAAEGIAERTFADLLRDTLFIPLGMTHTLPSQIDSTRPAVLAALAKPYRTDGAEPEAADWPRPLEVNAGAGVISSVLDLARFDIAFDDAPLLASQTRAAMSTPARSSTTGEPLPYGLGWFVQAYNGERLMWHYGWQPGAYSGLWLRVPQRGLTLVLLANSEDLSAPFNLAVGDVTSSPFAQAFLEAFLE